MKLWHARLAFGSPDLSTSLLFATVNGWFLFYLVSVVEMPALLAGAIFVVGRLLDGLLDPLIGALTDRYGRKRVIVVALPAAALTFVVLWSTPALVTDPVARPIALCATFSLFVVAYTCVSIPRLGMLPRFAPDYHERTGQVAVDMAFVFVAVLISSVAFPALVATFSPTASLSESAIETWIGVSVAVAALAVLAYLPFILFIADRPRLDQARRNVSAFSHILAMRHTKGALRTISLFASSVLALVSLQSIMPFWLEVGPQVTASEQSIVFLSIFVSMLMSLPGWTLFSFYVGKTAGLCAGVLVFIVGIVLAALLEAGSGLSAQLIIASFVAGAGAGALSMFPWAMIPDVAEVHSARRNESIEGTTTAAFTMTNKLSVAVALFLNSAVLQMSSGGLAINAAPSVLLFLPTAFAVLTFLIAARGRQFRSQPF